MTKGGLDDDQIEYLHELAGERHEVWARHRESQAATREFLFNYRFAGAYWNMTVFARDPAEAKEKIKAMALARYEGEIAAKIPAAIPGAGILVRLLCWWKSPRR